ncbi:MAG: DNA recombination protein RmuC [Candidatus Korarchaeota archaeon]|nr:DNA recombination protein RmuC [Thermoproteota archaeon]MCR8471981.1 DNA recombination protein RmuC [Thermoproteota archaeon]MCR8488611.1 DNA recombination protein RmuC [Thermoproteota archaeon]
MIEYLLIAFIVLLVFLLYNYKSKIEELGRKLSDLEVSIQQRVENSVMRMILGVQGDIGRLEGDIGGLKEIANNLKNSASDLGASMSDLKNMISDLKSMFEITSKKAAFGEVLLENLLKDILPRHRVGIREKIGSVVPDCHIKVSENRYLCIDSKFPLENYKKFCRSVDPKDKDEYREKFLKDLKAQIESIRSKYVGKENMMNFALMFIPSDAIYYTAVSEFPEIAIEAAKNGVILTSPSTLPAHLSLILRGIWAEEVFKNAERIKEKIDELGEYLKDLEGELQTLLMHLKNAGNAIPRVQSSFDELKSFYSSLSRLQFLEERK